MIPYHVIVTLSSQRRGHNFVPWWFPFLFLYILTSCQGGSNLMTLNELPTDSPINTKTTFPTNTPIPKTAWSSLNDVFWLIHPGQISEENIRVSLGKPTSINREGENRLYWDYQLPGDTNKTLLRIRFHESQVVEIDLYKSKLTVDELIQKMGTPPLVYQVDISEERTGWYNRVFFAYPEQGYFAYVDSPNPTPTDLIKVVLQKPAQDLSSYLEHIQSQTNVRIITWP